MFGTDSVQQPRRIGFFLVPRFSMIAFTCAIEPLRAANRLSGRSLYQWRTLSMDGEAVSASNDIPIVPDGSTSETDPPDVLFVCAGLQAERFKDPRAFAWLRGMARKHVTMGALCTGSLILAHAGLLDGYRCTIHWENVESFAEEYPDLDITATLFEIDRDRCTCCGGTTPLDMMVSFIAHDHGEDLAVSVAEQLLHNFPRGPQDPQRASLERRTGISHPKLLAAMAHMEAHVEEPTHLADIASFVGLSARQMERLFREHLDKKPSRYYLELRLQRARLLLQQRPGMSILQIAVASGFASAAHFARCYREIFGKSPSHDRGRQQRIPG